MSQDKGSFRHESLQDSASIQGIIEALAKGLARGEIRLSDEVGDILLRPEGLLNLRLTANKEDGRQRLNLRISWQVDEDERTGKTLRVE